MSDEQHVPEGSPGPGKEGVPALPVRPDAAQPATTSDLVRFPEVAETPEITSLLQADAGIGEVAPGRAHAPSSPADAKTPTQGAAWTFDPQIEIERKLGAGGMGEVYLGLQKHLGRKVAIKRIRDWGEDAENKERFIHEAKAQSCLRHPGIAQVYDLREADGALYLIMEHVEGKTLEELQKTEKKFSPERIARIGIQLTEALETAAHEGYIHRDLKPGNVMLTEGGKVKIIDFGLALRFRNLMRTRFTQKGEILGTPAYMSPEQLNQEEKLDVRSDIWSLGVLLYALATGEPPFTGMDFVCTVKNVMMAEPVPLPAIEESFPAGLWEVIKRALRKKREERWQDYASFRTALLRYEGAPTTVPPEARSTGAAQTEKSGARLLRMAGYVVAASLAIAAFLIPHLARDPKENSKNNQERHPPGALAREKFLENPKKGEPSERTPELAPKNPIEKPTGDAAKIVPPRETISPAPRLRDKLLAKAPSPGAVRLVEQLLGRFERRYQDLRTLSYEGLSMELGALADLAPAENEPPVTPEETEFARAYLGAAREMLGLSRGALESRLGELRTSSGPVELGLRRGGTLRGTVESVTTESIVLQGEGGQSVAVPLRDLSPEEFRPKAAPPTAELAFEALSVNPAKALPALLELEEKGEEILFWVPIVVRLARLQVSEEAREAALAAKPLLLEKRPAESQAACLAHASAASAAEISLKKCESKVLPVYAYLGEEFARAKRETEAIELLFHRQFSRLAAAYRSTASGPVAVDLLLAIFEKEISASAEELLAGSAWFNKRWELRPSDKDPLERAKYLVPGSSERPLVLQDPDGPRSLVMNDSTPKECEGILVRLTLAPLGNCPDDAQWRFHLLSETGGMTYLRIDRVSIELWRSTLAPGTKDVRLARAQLPQLPVEPVDRTYVLIPAGDHLHVYADRQLVLSIPRGDGMIPKQLSLTIYHAKASIRNLEVLRAPAKDGGPRK